MLDLLPAECLHGGDDRGETQYGMTVFPQPIALAAAFDKDMMYEIAGIISEEMRAASNMSFPANLNFPDK
jgi:beta-glucosidase